MNRPAIKVEGLSKLYRMGARAPYRRLTELLTSAILSPFRLFHSAAALADLPPPSLKDSRFSDAPPGFFWSLKDVNFKVPEGEAIGIIGRNGAGKSTLLKVLSRITEPTRGRIEICGRVGSLLEVGTGFHSELSGRDNIFLNGAILGMSRGDITRKFDEIVAFAEVERFLESPVKHYSSGMYMRLAFAVAAHLEPDVLIVDEVLSVGDASFQKKCLGKMDDVAKTGRTVLFVSHNMPAIRTMCKTCLWLEAGQVQESGSAATIVSNYLTGLSAESAAFSGVDVLKQLRKDPLLTLLDLSIVQEQFTPDRFISGKPIRIGFEYQLKADADGFHLYIQLLDHDGIIIFESIHNGHLEFSHTSAGRYISHVVIPANFLNQGNYKIVVLAGIQSVRSCLEPAIVIPFHIDRFGLVNQAYPGYLAPGQIAPLLDWQTQFLGPQIQSDN